MAGPEEQPARVDASSIYAALRAEILDGTLSPGTSAREVALASRFGVSRTPVREALRRLEHDRLLVAGPRGLVVRAIDTDEVIQIYDVRILLEGEAAFQAASSRTTADVVRLEGLLDRDRSLSGPEDALRARTNMEFHETIWAAAHNAVLDDLMHRLTVHLVRTPHSTLSATGRWEEALGEHAAILDAIRDRDGDLARELASAHMARAREIRLQLLRESPALRR